MRRVSSIATVWTGETQTTMDGYARETRDGSVLDEATVSAATEGPDRTLTSLRVSPDVADIGALLGVGVGPGFRSRARAAVPDTVEHTALGLLLDDLPVAALVAG